MRRRAKLAASVVVTVAALGCDKANDTGPRPPATIVNTPGTSVNPPGPPTTTATTTTTPPPQDEYTSIDVEHRSCYRHTRHLVEGNLVDKTPPEKIDCPKERVWKGADGQCSFSFPDPCQHSGCNPPPPQPVECPPGM
jgi:hypothetical protein